MDIEQLELEHIIAEFTIKNMPDNLAMLFITQDIDFDDIFSQQFNTNAKFYKKVFSYVWKYVQIKIDRGDVDVVVRDVINKLKCSRFIYKLSDRDFMFPDGFSSRLLKGILEYILNDGDFNVLNYVIDIIAANPDINNDVIYDILASNTDLCHQYVLSNIISSEYLYMDQIFNLLLLRSKEVPRDTIRELVLDIFNNKNLLLVFARYVYSKFRITSTVNRNGSISVEMTCLLTKKEDKEILMSLRDMLIEIIWIDAELDFYDFLVESYEAEKNARNIYISGIYDTYIRWFRSREREETSFRNMLFNNFEEDLEDMHIDSDNLLDMSSEMCLLKYLMETENLEGYDLFIKLFNINRFALTTFRNTYTVNKYFEKLWQTDQFFITMALSNSFYIFLCFR